MIRKMADFNLTIKKYLLNVIILLSFFLSLGSLYVSYKAYTLSKNTNIMTNRPILNVNVDKKDDTKQYIKIHREGKSIIMSFIVRIENVGNSIAENISFPKDTRSFAEDKGKIYPKKMTKYKPKTYIEKKIVESRNINNLSLAPGDEFFLHIENEETFNNENEAIKQYAIFNSDKWEGILIDLPVYYTNVNDVNNKYKTVMRQVVSVNKVRVLKNELITVK